MARFDEFSAAYYVGRLAVDRHDGERAVMDRDEHEAANERVYATGDGLERVDHPLVMKVGDSYVPVVGAEDVPTDTVALPDPVFAATDVTDPPTVTDVLLAKADRARQLLEWFSPYSLGVPDYA